MNREVKFRAWDKGNGIWQYFTLEELSNGVNKDFHQFLENWGEYTSLKDKKKKEIYEGDICRESNEDGEYLYQVYWDKYDGYILKPINFKSGLYHGLGTLYTDLEVIGSIYRNPELLKK